MTVLAPEYVAEVAGRTTGCRVCGASLVGKSVFRHYLTEHPRVAAVTWKCCIPASLKIIPEVAAARRAKGWDA